MRAALAQEIFDVVEELGPTVFDDFESQRALASASADTQQRKSASGPDVLSHPLAWLDEKRASIVVIFSCVLKRTETDNIRPCMLLQYLAGASTGIVEDHPTDRRLAEDKVDKTMIRPRPAQTTRRQIRRMITITTTKRCILIAFSRALHGHEKTEKRLYRWCVYSTITEQTTRQRVTRLRPWAVGEATTGRRDLPGQEARWMLPAARRRL
jgi:hypothetical protein